MPAIPRRPAATRRRIRVAATILSVGTALVPVARAAEPAVAPDAITELSPRELDLTGRWLLRHVVQRSERAAFRGLELVFRVDLVQDGRRITGTAEKWRENGRELAPAARSRLEIEGTLEGEEIVGRFVETGAGRKSTGSFRWRYSVESGWLTGTFRTNVASSAGQASAIAIG